MAKKTIIGAVLLLIASATAAFATGVPPLAGKRFHNESASIKLAGPEAEKIEGKLADLERKHGGMQMAVLILESLEGDSIENISLKAAERWQLGQKRRKGVEGDNGLLLVIAVRDRKYRFEVGYGLEQSIPDSLAGTIGRAILVPALRDGRTVEGIDHVIDAIAGVVQAIQEPTPQAAKEEELRIDNSVWAAGIMIVVAAGFGIFHFLLGGLIGLFEGAGFAWFFVGHGALDMLLYAVAGFFLGVAAKIIVRIALEIGISGALGGGSGDGFSGGGGGFGGGGASGSW